jgi:glycine betaine/choline ABC-type transport system substrate-binding protein
MSTYISVSCVCGASYASIDIYDLEYTGDIWCSANCKAISAQRKDWEKVYA